MTCHDKHWQKLYTYISYNETVRVNEGEEGRMGEQRNTNCLTVQKRQV